MLLSVGVSCIETQVSFVHDQFCFVKFLLRGLDSDESDFSDSDAEHANVMFSRHTVALDSNLEERDFQRGIYYRHNFLVNKYNNVQAQNFMQLRVGSNKHMYKFISLRLFEQFT